MSLEIDASEFAAGLERMFGDARMLDVQRMFTQIVYDDTREECPVDTGNLHDTAEQTTYGVGDGEVVYPADYATYVHEGTSRQAAQPWIERTAAARSGEWAEKIGSMILGGA